MLTVIYLFILAYFGFLLVREVIREKRFTMQLTAAVLLVPVMLRLLLLK